MTYILNESWHGMERVSEEWCREQAKSIMRVINESRCEDEDYLDSEGLIELLNEMAERDYRVAESYACLIMEHLLNAHVSPTNDSKKHWLKEVNNFTFRFKKNGLGVSPRRKLGNTNIKRELQEQWAEIYAEAVEEVLKKANDAWIYQFDVSKIPDEVPWTVEDFLTKSSGALLSMIEK